MTGVVLLAIGLSSVAVLVVIRSVQHVRGRAEPLRSGRGPGSGRRPRAPGRLARRAAGLVRGAAGIAGAPRRAVRAAWRSVRARRGAPSAGRIVAAPGEVDDGPYADADTAEDPDGLPAAAVPGAVRPVPAAGDSVAGSAGPGSAGPGSASPGSASPGAGTGIPRAEPGAAGSLSRVSDSMRAWLWGEQGAAREFLLASQSVTVGRDPDCGIVLDDLTISREHATLDYKDGGWWLLPGVTGNGTWLNGNLVQPGERIPVGDGDRLRFGLHTQLRMLVPPPLAEPMMRFVAAARTTPGARMENQDAHLATEQLLVVADGLSDRPFPRVASWTAVREIADAPPGIPLPDVIDRVNEVVHARGSDAMELKGMATTLDLVRLRRDEARGWRVEGAHVGDGQVLLQDGFGIRKMTRDGTAGGRLAAIDPARAERHAGDPEFNRLTSAVGFARPIEPDTWWVHADRDQRLVLATDGLVNALGTDGICAALRHSRDDGPARVADMLVRLAMKAGASDNVTIIVADIAGSAQSDRRGQREI